MALAHRSARAQHRGADGRSGGVAAQARGGREGLEPPHPGAWRRARPPRLSLSSSIPLTALLLPPASASLVMRGVAVLGSTGSIGRARSRVLARHATASRSWRSPPARTPTLLDAAGGRVPPDFVGAGRTAPRTARRHRRRRRACVEAAHASRRRHRAQRDRRRRRPRRDARRLARGQARRAREQGDPRDGRRAGARGGARGRRRTRARGFSEHSAMLQCIAGRRGHRPG